MHSWVFRNRARLRLVYGGHRPQPLPLPALTAPLQQRLQGTEGRILRRKHYVLLMPVRRRSA